MTKRYIPTRVVADKRAPKRYQRSGWLVFDTRNPIAAHLFVNTRYEAMSICNSRNAIAVAPGAAAAQDQPAP
jgi:hypothetical protein